MPEISDKKCAYLIREFSAANRMYRLRMKVVSATEIEMHMMVRGILRPTYFKT